MKRGTVLVGKHPHEVYIATGDHNGVMPVLEGKRLGSDLRWEYSYMSGITNPDRLTKIDTLCRCCCVEHGIPRQKKWSGLGICPVCREHHVLFSITREADNGDDTPKGE